MTDGYTTRKLVRQEWKPLGGRRVEVYVVATTGASMPGMEWTDDLPSNSEIVNEVLGYVEWPSNTWPRRFEDEEAFREYVEEEAEFVQWIDGEGFEDFTADIEVDETIVSDENKEPEQTQLDGVSEDSEATEDGVVAVCSECGFSHDEIACWDDDAVITEEGVVEYDPEDEPYTLPEDATEQDVKEDVVYEGRISDIKPYGFFVNLTESKPDDSEVSGLVHNSKLGLQQPGEFVKHETVSVEVEDFTNGISFYLVESESGADALNKVKEEADD